MAPASPELVYRTSGRQFSEGGPELGLPADHTERRAMDFPRGNDDAVRA